MQQVAQVDLTDLAQKRREILSRCYQIILSDEWGQSENVPCREGDKSNLAPIEQVQKEGENEQ